MPTYNNSYARRRKADAESPISYDALAASRNYVPNSTIPGTPSAGGNNVGGLKGAFSNWKTAASNLGTKAAPYVNPNSYNWSKGAGLKFTNPNTGKVANIGKWGNIAGGVMQGIDALQGISSYNDVVQDNRDLMSKISVSAMGNPLLSSYLTSDQLNLLDDIRDGRYDGSDAGLDTFVEGALSGLGSAIIPGVIGGLTGGIPGAIIGAGGTLLNAGIDHQSDVAGQSTAELQALYQALQDAEMQYRSMKRPNFTGLGIQQRYQDMYA